MQKRNLIKETDMTWPAMMTKQTQEVNKKASLILQANIKALEIYKTIKNVFKSNKKSIYVARESDKISRKIQYLFIIAWVFPFGGAMPPEEEFISMLTN